MRRILLSILLLFPVLLASAQTVSTRNNYTGPWTERGSWEQNWAGISNTTPLPAGQISLYGYIGVGRSNLATDLQVVGSGNTLTIYDTLRIHGNLLIANYATLTVETGGLLIVHGIYEQSDWARITVRGKMVVMGDFKMVGSTGPSTTSGGHLYVGGRSSVGGWGGMTVKTLTDLANEDPTTSSFAQMNIVNNHCSGTNSGTLTFSGTAARILHWESSIDYFKSDIQYIANTTSQLTYTNLLRTTSYRVYYDTGKGVLAYSNGATVFITDPPLAGEISGQSEFCGSASSIDLTLSKHTGLVKRWEWSTDNFTTVQSQASTSESFTLTNVTQTTHVRAVVSGCSDVVTVPFKITSQQPPYGGTIQGAATVCSDSNSGTLTLKDNIGPVLRWESSADGFKTVTIIANTTTTLSYSNLTQNTSYRAIVSNSGICSEARSNAVEIKVVLSLNETTLAVAGYPLPATGLLANYSFIKNANDASANGNHGIVVGATPAADRFGRANNAFSMDGVDDFITTTYPFFSPGPNNFSLSLWFKTSSTSGGKLIGGGKMQTGLSSNYDRHIYLNNKGQLYFGVYLQEYAPNGQKSIQTPGSYNDGKWHHVIASLSASGMKLHVDGVLQSNDTRYTSGEDYTGFWRMGYDNLGGWPDHPSSLYFSGTLDDIAIFNRELSSDEITQLNKMSNGPYCPGENVQLKAAVIPRASYLWSGPEGFSSVEQSPLLTNIQPYQTGTYTVKITLIGGCEYTGSVDVYVATPETAGALATDQKTVCAGSNSGSLRLENYTGSVHRWESSVDGFKTITAVENTTASLTFSNLSQNTSYRAMLSSSGTCPLTYSNILEIQVIQNLDESTLAASGSSVPTTGLIAYYPFIKNANDASASGNHGIVVGATPTADRFDRANSAYAFDGVDDYITTTNKFPAPGPNNFSLSLWFKTSSTSGGKLIGGGSAQVGKSYNYDRHIYLNNKGQLHFGIYLPAHYPNGTKVIKTTGSYNDGKWHHVVASLSASGMKLYVDGVLQSSDARYTVAEDYAGFWRIGFDNGVGWPDLPSNPYFSGALDDISIYNRELSASDITQLLQVNTGPYCPGQNVQLAAAVVPGATYAWTGPEGFTSAVQNPLITGILSAQAGTYSVSISVGDCKYTASTTVAVAGRGAVVASETTVCSGNNTGTLRLENYTGDIVRWESSTDNFTSNVVEIANTTAEQSFTNLTVATSYRAVVRSLTCGEGYSAAATVQVTPQSKGGSLSGPASVCKGINSGTLTLADYLGNILNWEYSDDGFIAHSQSIANTTASFSFSNLSANRWFRAVVKNGVCNPAYSTIFKVTVTEIAGGTLSGPERVCAGSNSGTLALSSHIGTIKRWEWSNDGFNTHVQTLAHTETTYTFINISADTWYRAIAGNAECGETASAVHVVRIDVVSQGGTITGPASVCKDTNSGTLTLAGHLGQILNWESSDDGFVANTQSIANTTASLSFSNLSSNRWYRAVVKNGTCSAAYSAIFKVTVTEIARGSVSGPERVCASANTGTLQLQNSLGTIKRWEWSNDGFQTHIQTITHTQASYTFNNISADTWYRAVVANTECGEKASDAHVVRVDQPSLGGSISGTDSVCKGINSGTLTLSAHLGQVLRWEYSTDAFVSQVQSVVNTSTILAFSDLTASRWYRAVVQNGSCTTVYSTTFKVTVTELVGGTVNGPSVVCQSGNSGTLLLQGYIGNVIRWESSTDSFSANLQSLNNNTSSYSFTNLSTDTWYRVVVGNADCGETFSAVWKVAVDLPSLGGDVAGATSYCSTQNSGTLELQNQRGVILRWETSTDDFVANVQQIAHTSASYSYTNLALSTSFRAVVQNGSCAVAYATAAKVVIESPAQAGSVAGAATVCAGENSGTLVLESKLGQVVRWESSTDNFASFTAIANTGDNLNYQNLISTTAYRAVVQNGTCDEVYSQSASITVDPAVQAGMVAGSRVVVTDSNTGELRLQEYSGQILYWESSSDNFITNVQRIENISEVQHYENLTLTTWYRATVHNTGSACAPAYSAVAQVSVNHAPLAQTDTLLITEAVFTAQRSVLLNDRDPDGDALTVVPAELKTAAGGSASIDQYGILYYQSPENYVGYDSLSYTVCDQVSGAVLCSESLIVLDVRLPAPALIIYQGVSPNGDDENDYWHIKFIERYPDNLVSLYDRYGALVFEQQSYNNSDKVFIGKGNRGARPGGNELPEGTYFYKITTSSQAPVLKGYIVLKK